MMMAVAFLRLICQTQFSLGRNFFILKLLCNYARRRGREAVGDQISKAMWDSAPIRFIPLLGLRLVGENFSHEP